MQGITTGHLNTPEAMARRLGDIERALGKFSNFNGIVEVPGGTKWQMELLGKFSGVDRPKAYANVGGPWYAYVTDAEAGWFAIGKGHFIINAGTGEELSVTGIGFNHNIEKNLKMWIRFSIKPDCTCSAAEIQAGKEWPNEMIVFEGTPPVQTKAYVCIGELLLLTLDPKEDQIDGDGGFVAKVSHNGSKERYHFTQKLTTNLFLALMTVDGKAAVYPLPFAG